MSTKKVTKRSFTLMEVLIVLAILATTAGLFSFSAARALKQQRFQTDARLILQEIALAQDLMFLLNTDTTLLIQNREGEISIGIRAATALSKQWQKVLKDSNKPLNYLEQITFAGQTVDAQSRGEIELFFFSKGSVMSRGILELKSGPFSKEICLRGYPHPIRFKQSGEEKAPCEDPATEALAYALTRMTQEQIFGSDDENEKTIF